MHLSDDLPCQIGSYVTVGHTAIVHACTVGDQTLIGMGAVVLDGAVIGPRCLVGARALVTPGTQIPEGSLVLGAPAKVARTLTDKERADLKLSAEKYAQYAAYCVAHEINVSAPLSTYLLWD